MLKFIILNSILCSSSSFYSPFFPPPEGEQSRLKCRDQTGSFQSQHSNYYMVVPASLLLFIVHSNRKVPKTFAFNGSDTAEFGPHVPAD